jgi:hypothetical protein
VHAVLWVAVGIATPACVLIYRIAVLLVAYRLVIKTGKVDAIQKMSVLINALGGEPIATSAKRHLENRRNRKEQLRQQ